MAITRLGRRGMGGSHEEPQLETFSPLSHLTVVLQLHQIAQSNYGTYQEKNILKM
jgi:hypothetical protein